jgi:hypothetical protein
MCDTVAGMQAEVVVRFYDRLCACMELHHVHDPLCLLIQHEARRALQRGTCLHKALLQQVGMAIAWSTLVSSPGSRSIVSVPHKHTALLIAAGKHRALGSSLSSCLDAGCCPCPAPSRGFPCPARSRGFSCPARSQGLPMAGFQAGA